MNQYDNQSEHQIQKLLMEWWLTYCYTVKIPEHLLYAVPNGGNRNAITGARLKAEGVRRGVPDLCLAVPKHPFHGMYIELKKDKRQRLSPFQKEFLEDLWEQQYFAIVCKSFNDARVAIEKYLTDKKYRNMMWESSYYYD